MIAAINALAFACLVLAVPAGTFLGAWLLLYGSSRELNRDQRNGYKLSPEAMPQSRPVPKWMRGERK